VPIPSALAVYSGVQTDMDMAHAARLYISSGCVSWMIRIRFGAGQSDRHNEDESAHWFHADPDKGDRSCPY